MERLKVKGGFRVCFGGRDTRGSCWIGGGSEKKRGIKDH